MKMSFKKRLGIFLLYPFLMLFYLIIMLFVGALGWVMVWSLEETEKPKEEEKPEIGLN